MNFLRQKLFMRDTPAALSTSGKPLPLNYKLSTFRWHLDSRPPSKAILVHDLFSSSASWQTLLHGSIGKMPGRGLTPRVPLELYAVELRGHNYSMSVPFPEEGSPFALTCASDVLLLQQQIIRTDAKFIGIGFWCACCLPRCASVP
ncbi:hypothetical protein, unlikely [Trypanosoma congolense IL3000]|uniref:Uncharacterized protein n=1 Tax=Trypanosoma congolense (strain IL3000) TaxID=1068625 RepID=F9W377_TRYCI|nr:hypothetical protein, unlikely [Trypanosoma congolense IL3000]